MSSGTRSKRSTIFRDVDRRENPIVLEADDGETKLISVLGVCSACRKLPFNQVSLSIWYEIEEIEKEDLN